MGNLSQEVTLIIISTVFLLIVAIGVINLVLIYQKKQLQYQREKDKQMMEGRLDAQEQTLKKVSQELHDNIGQVLTLAKLNINTICADDPKEWQEKIDSTRDLLTKAIQDLRDLSKSLNSDFVTDRGLPESIEYELQLVKKATTYTTCLFTDGEPYKLPKQHELVLFRIFQEVLNNIIKHAKASDITIHLHYHPHNFTLKIQDNGRGFDLHPLQDNQQLSQGLGIRNMQNRAQQIGADFKIESNIGGGTIVKIDLPLPLYNKGV